MNGDNNILACDSIPGSEPKLIREDKIENESESETRPSFRIKTVNEKYKFADLIPEQ